MVHARLLDIAIREFGTKGLDGASTRGIAAAADTAMSSITYHYGGKEGLYLAAADHIAAQMADGFDGLTEAKAAVELGDAVAARSSLHRMLAEFADKMAGGESDEWAPFIIREQMAPTQAFDRIYDGAMGTMLETIAQLICTATRIRDLPEARVVTLTLMGQALVLRAARAMCLRLLETSELPGVELKRFQGRMVVNIDAILDRLIAEQQGNA